MNRKIFTMIVTLVFALLIAGCSGGAPEPSSGYQEQYDLGMRYLEEGKYDEAILAFSAAIEIDTKQPMAYVGRGDAYIALTQPDKAATDYEQALILDESMADVYIKLADTYIELGDETKAIETLERGLDETGDESIRQRLDEMRSEESAEDDLDVVLTDEQLAFLEPLEEAVLAMDYEAAYAIQSSTEFQELCDDVGSEERAVYKVKNGYTWTLDSYTNDYYGKTYRLVGQQLKNGNGYIMSSEFVPGNSGSYSHVYIDNYTIADSQANGAYKTISYLPDDYGNVSSWTGTVVDGLKHGESLFQITFDDSVERQPLSVIFNNGKVTNYQQENRDGEIAYFIKDPGGKGELSIDPNRTHIIELPE